ncbi:hypothetical protein ACG3SL_18885 [Sphingomonas sp. CJ20]
MHRRWWIEHPLHHLGKNRGRPQLSTGRRQSLRWLLARDTLSGVKRSRAILLSIAGIVAFLILTLPYWGMGSAVFLDSERSVISRASSPDGKRIAQVERVIVGGEPSIVILVRRSWEPDWYLTGCVAASHYQDEQARIEWASNARLIIFHGGPQSYWDNSAPFHNNPCSDVTAIFQTKGS